MRLLYSAIICMLIAISSFAQTTWIGVADNDWNNDSNWTANAPSTGVLAVILASPNNPVISSGLNIDFEIQNFATITLNADVINNGAISNFDSGIIINNANFTNSSGQSFFNNGQLLNTSTFNNLGFLQGSNVGVIENTAAAVFNNNSGATIQNFAMIENAGILNNDGGILNFSVFDNYGQVFNNGPLTQGVSGIFNNQSGAVLNNNNSVSNSGIMNNQNDATIHNNDFIQNNSDGTFQNYGTLINNNEIVNAGFFENSGELTNNQEFTNDFGANLMNSGLILNSSCATFNQYTSNPVAIDFTNNGIVYQIAGAGTVNINDGSGVVLNDINQEPAPTAACQDIIVVLDVDGNATIEPLDIDDNSSAGYCAIADFQININSFTCADLGPNAVTLTVTDEFGATDFCTAIVTVVDGTAPEMSCSQNIIINLSPGECEAHVDFNDPVVTDICGFTLSRTDNTGLNSGDAFPIGTSTIMYQATDGTNISNCSFDITVIPYPNPSSSLACNSLVEISLDENCQTYINADFILEGGPYACYNNYLVEIFYDQQMEQLIPTSPIITGQQINDTLYASVTDPINGNSCWGKIIVKDYIAPQIICEDITVTCQEDTSPQIIGYPASFDNCDNGLFPGYSDELSGDPCTNLIITRTWTVADASGNSSNCQQIITVVRPDFSLLVFPSNLDNLDQPALNCADNPNPIPDVTGWPTINGQNIQNTCNFDVVYTDDIISVCGASYTLLRSWQAFDWCTGESASHVQVIKIMDTEGPILTCPENIEIINSQNTCTAALILPLPEIEASCSAIASTSVTASAGQIINGELVDLPAGLHTITYLVTDECGNESSCSFTITVVDEIPPVAICESSHNISLTIDEPTLVPALVFDDGSYDNCSGLIYEVRRMDAPQCPGADGTVFSSHVPFYCCDVTGVVMVELRITDAGGNTNSCMVEVIVEDKLNPQIFCPADITLTCYDDYSNLTVTGEATATDNCGFTINYFDNGTVDNCGGGIINRIWTATDPGGLTASCVQKITVSNADPFFISDTNCNNSNPNDGIIWPCDYTAVDCSANTDPSITGHPQVFENACDLVSVTYEDIELPVSGSSCLKIIRIWSVYDWCQFDQASGSGVWNYNQIIKVMNTEAPGFTSACEDLSFCSYEEDCGDAPIQMTIEATDDCSADEDLNYFYTIDLNNDGSTNVTGSGNDASGTYPLGTHRIKWFVEDGCGNMNTCTHLFVIADCKNPTPYCLNGLAVELMQNINEIEIAATAFDQGSFDNCGIDEWLIVSPSQGTGQNTPPAPATATVIFDCEDVGTQTVDVWVSDIFGNWAYCTTYIIIQDNAGNCPEQTLAGITGTIANEAGETLESVKIHVDGNAPWNPDAFLTTENGIFNFEDLTRGFDYTIRPEKNEDPMNGVSTVDLVLMNRHLLGTQIFDSPYKMIAADLNASNSISTLDKLLLRRMILQLDDDFTSNTSWRFVPADFVFPNPTNPFATAFPEVYLFSELSQDVTADFVAVKIGDVNSNAVMNNLTGESDDRNLEDPMVFTLQDEHLIPGRMYQIDFRAADINKIQGYQYTLNFDLDLLTFNNVIPGELPGLNLSNFGLNRYQEGVITTSWNREEGFESLEENSVLFSLVFEAKTSSTWSEALKITSQFTRAEAYNPDLKILDVLLAFENSEEDRQKFKIYPNQPNPFSGQTLISFSLPENTPLNFSIHDVSGTLAKSIDMDAPAGYNEIIIFKNDLNGPGVYFYTIKTETHRVTERMVLIKE